MTGLAIQSNTAEFDAGAARASLYIPDRTRLVQESFYRTDRHLRNTADRDTAQTLESTPTVGALSTVVVTGTSGVDTQVIGSLADYTVAAIFKRPSAGSAGGIFITPTAYLGLRYNAGDLLFHNTQTGSAPNVGAITLPVTSDFIFGIGFGIALTQGEVAYGEADALAAAVSGSTAGGSRSTTNTFKAGGVTTGTLTFEIAWSAVFARILSTAEQLALYQQARAAAAVEGITVI